MEEAIRYVCTACGFETAGDERRPFRCPHVDDRPGRDHLLERRLRPELVAGPRPGARKSSNPFLRYRHLLWAYQAACRDGLSDERFVRIVERLDRAVSEVSGGGFEETPLVAAEALAADLPIATLWVKDETRGVAGSHKARHLMGLMIWIEASREAGGEELAPLAIASCGNAALAAVVVARAARRSLRVFVPVDAREDKVGRLERWGAEIERCDRTAGSTGDPSLHGLRSAVTAGALPFTCQGPENGLAVEGGQTLVYEMLAALRSRGRSLDRVVVQVGGGALATAVARAFEEAVACGELERLPRIDTVQTSGAAPLARAYRLVARRLGRPAPSAAPEPVAVDEVEEVLAYAARRRSEFMWPWEEVPRSIASGILDDETYDWRAVVRAMLISGGQPLVVGDDRIAEANARAREATGIRVSNTGSAGFAGVLELEELGALAAGEDVGVLFTGAARP